MDDISSILDSFKQFVEDEGEEDIQLSFFVPPHNYSGLTKFKIDHPLLPWKKVDRFRNITNLSRSIQYKTGSKKEKSALVEEMLDEMEKYGISDVISLKECDGQWEWESLGEKGLREKCCTGCVIFTESMKQG